MSFEQTSIMPVTCDRILERTLNICSKHENWYWNKYIKIKVSSNIWMKLYHIRKHKMKPCECRVTSSVSCLLPFYKWNLKTGGKIGKLCEVPAWFHQVLLVTGTGSGGRLYCGIWRFDSYFHYSLSCKESHRAAAGPPFTLECVTSRSPPVCCLK